MPRRRTRTALHCRYKAQRRASVPILWHGLRRFHSCHRGCLAGLVRLILTQAGPNFKYLLSSSDLPSPPGRKPSQGPRPLGRPLGTNRSSPMPSTVMKFARAPDSITIARLQWHLVFARLQLYGVYTRICQAYNNEPAPRRSIPQPGGTVSPCLDRHFATASALFLHAEGVSSDARCLQIAKARKRARRSDGIGFLSRDFWNGLDRGDAPGASRDALNRRRPYYLGPGLQCMCAGADRQQGYWAKLQLWPVAADSCDELTPGSATPTLHKVRAEVDGGQALTGGTNETVAIFDAVDGAHATRSRRELTPSPCLPRTGSAVT